MGLLFPGWTGPEPREGARIVLMDMPEDPDPVPTGTEGTITNINPVNWPGRGFIQVDVDWDNGRGLSLSVPPDRCTVKEDNA